MQSRDYLDEEERVWLGGESGIALMSLDEPSRSRVQAIETNSYPFSTPMLSEDGDMLVYLSDADSTDVTDTEVRFSRSEGGGQFGIGTVISALGLGSLINLNFSLLHFRPAKVHQENIAETLRYLRS